MRSPIDQDWRYNANMRWALVVGLVTACASTPVAVDLNKTEVDRVIASHPASTRTIPEPTTLAGKPWQVGQWALYIHRGANAQPAYQRIRIVGEGSCGMWISAEARTYRNHFRWRLCIHPGERVANVLDLVQVFIIQHDGAAKTVDVHSGDSRVLHDREGFISALLPPQIADNDPRLAREDVDVPAGHFIRVLRETVHVDDGSEVLRWFSPDVPFDGTIKRQTKAFDFVLLAYGDSSTPDDSGDW